MAERPGKRAFRVLAALAIAALTLALGLAALAAFGIDVERRVWLARRALLGPEAVGIWQADPRLGWRHTPGAVGRQRVVPDFDVTYRIDEDGGRRTPGRPDSGPAILFLGGSFTFGHGVEDEETYPALLQARWRDHRVVNRATNAWGTAHAVSLLPELLESEPDVALVVYGFITHHLKRNHRSRTWLTQLDEARGRRNPYFAIEDGRLVHRGLADPERDALDDDAELLGLEVNMTAALLYELAKICADHGVPLVVVHLPDGSGSPALRVLEQTLGAERVIDLSRSLDYATLHYPHDLHLTPEGHARVADALGPELRARARTDRGSASGGVAP